MAEANDTSHAAAAFALVDKADWVQRLACNDKGVLLPVLDNVVSILANDERWAGVIAYDEMGGRVMKLRPPPFERGEVGEWMDIDDARLEHWLATTFKLRRLSSDTLAKAVLLAADAHRYHEVRDYLRGLVWDGEPRVATWLFTYLGAEPTDYCKAVATKWMVGAVARAMRAGCKMDNVLILEGDQGLGKSTALKVLFQPWFTDAAFELGSTDGYQIMRGMWCVELAELDGFNRAEASRSKAFFTRTEDRYRNPYGRKPVTIPRNCVFSGTVNHDTYLKDDTGNRRYWPVRVREKAQAVIQLDDLARDRDQLWAEALQLYEGGTEWWVRASEFARYEQEQDKRFIGDAFESRIKRWLQEPKEGAEPMNFVRLDQVMQHALHMEPAKMTLVEQQRVGRLMTRIGWKRERQASGNRDYYYCRPGHELKDRKGKD